MNRCAYEFEGSGQHLIVFFFGVFLNFSFSSCSIFRLFDSCLKYPTLFIINGLDLSSIANMLMNGVARFIHMAVGSPHISENIEGLRGYYNVIPGFLPLNFINHAWRPNHVQKLFSVEFYESSVGFFVSPKRTLPGLSKWFQSTDYESKWVSRKDLSLACRNEYEFIFLIPKRPVQILSY